MPDSVTSISSMAFISVATLTSVTLNEGLQTIGPGAFTNTSITEIIIPSTVITNIANLNSAFPPGTTIIRVP